MVLMLGSWGGQLEGGFQALAMLNVKYICKHEVASKCVCLQARGWGGGQNNRKFVRSYYVSGPLGYCSKSLSCGESGVRIHSHSIIGLFLLFEMLKFYNMSQVHFVQSFVSISNLKFAPEIA